MKKSMPERREKIPVYEQVMLTVQKAAAYTGIGVNKLREMSDEEGCDYVLWVGNRRLFKRRKLEEFIERAYSV